MVKQAPEERLKAVRFCPPAPISKNNHKVVFWLDFIYTLLIRFLKIRRNDQQREVLAHLEYRFVHCHLGTPVRPNGRNHLYARSSFSRIRPLLLDGARRNKKQNNGNDATLWRNRYIKRTLAKFRV